jgi:hypothetical protein
MKKRTAATIALLCIAALWSPSHSQADPPPPQAQWTFMVYVAVDNNLEHWFVQEFDKEYGNVGSDDNVKIVLLADRAPGYAKQAGNWEDTRFFYVEKGTTADGGVSWGERDMGDPQTLIDFIDYSQEHYPAERYALVMLGHSWAWRPDETMWDDTDDDALDLDELAAALDAVGAVDVVAYDACQAQVIEVETVWRDYAEYIVASEDTVWWEGFRQDKILTALKADPTMSEQQLAVLMAKNMTDRTVAAVAMGESWDNLLDAVTDWSAALLAGLPSYKAYYDDAYDNTLGMPGDALNKDLYDMAYEIWTSVPDEATEIKTTSQAVMDAFTPALIPYEWHHSNKYRDAEGIGIFWPRYVADLDIPNSRPNDFEYYQNLEFAELTGWDQFLAAYVGVDWPYHP